MKTINVLLSILFVAQTFISFAQSDTTVNQAEVNQEAEAAIKKYGIPGENNNQTGNTGDSTNTLSQTDSTVNPTASLNQAGSINQAGATTQSIYPQNPISLANYTIGSLDTIGFHYKTKVEIPVYLCDIVGNRLKGDTLYEAPIDATFTIIGSKIDPTTNTKMVIIRFWQWDATEEPQKVAAFNYADDKQTRRAYFLMSTTDFRYKTIRRYSMRPKFAMGIASMAVKVRNNPFSYETNLNLSSLFGVRFRLTPYTNTNYVNIMGGLGITSVNARANADSSFVSVGAISFKVGGVFEFSKVQVGLFMGQDYINESTNTNVKWSHQGRTWFSLGLGYNIFTSSTNEKLTFPPGRQ